MAWQARKAFAGILLFHCRTVKSPPRGDQPGTRHGRVLHRSTIDECTNKATVQSANCDGNFLYNETLSLMVDIFINLYKNYSESILTVSNLLWLNYERRCASMMWRNCRFIEARGLKRDGVRWANHALKRLFVMNAKALLSRNISGEFINRKTEVEPQHKHFANKLCCNVPRDAIKPFSGDPLSRFIWFDDGRCENVLKATLRI